MLTQPGSGDIERSLHEGDFGRALFYRNCENRPLHHRDQIRRLDRHGSSMPGLNVVERGAGALEVMIDQASWRSCVRQRDGRIWADVDERITVLQINHSIGTCPNLGRQGQMRRCADGHQVIALGNRHIAMAGDNCNFRCISMDTPESERDA